MGKVRAEIIGWMKASRDLAYGIFIPRQDKVREERTPLQSATLGCQSFRSGLPDAPDSRTSLHSHTHLNRGGYSMVAISPSRTLPVWQAARYEARQLLESNVWDGTYPVKITPFAHALDVKVNRTDLNHVSGLIVKKGRDMPAEVLLNSNESYQRRRFTLAHELGHLMERSTISGDQQFDFVDMRPDPAIVAQGNTYDLHEFYADEFAGALLMPADKVAELRQEGWSIARMATFFDVTPAAMSKRIARLDKHDEGKVPLALSS